MKNRRGLKPLVPLLWLALFSVTLQAQSLTCSVQLFRIEGELVAGPPDLTGLAPYATQTFAVLPGQRQAVKTVVGGVTLNSTVTVDQASEPQAYATLLDLELIERSETAPHAETKTAVNSRLVLKLNQPAQAGHSSESNGQAKYSKAWLVTLSP